MHDFLSEIYIKLTDANDKIVQIPISSMGVLREGQSGGTNIFQRYYNYSVFVTQSPDEIVDIIFKVKKEKS